jgi:hypothetical protein
LQALIELLELDLHRIIGSGRQQGTPGETNRREQCQQF